MKGWVPVICPLFSSCAFFCRRKLVPLCVGIQSSARFCWYFVEIIRKSIPPRDHQDGLHDIQARSQIHIPKILVPEIPPLPPNLQLHHLHFRPDPLYRVSHRPRLNINDRTWSRPRHSNMLRCVYDYHHIGDLLCSFWRRYRGCYEVFSGYTVLLGLGCKHDCLGDG